MPPALRVRSLADKRAVSVRSVGAGRDLLKETDVVLVAKDSLLQTSCSLSRFLKSDWSYDSVKTWMQSKQRRVTDCDSTLDHYLSTCRRQCELLIEQNPQAKVKHQVTETCVLVNQLDKEIAAMERLVSRAEDDVADTRQHQDDTVLDLLKAASLRLRTLSVNRATHKRTPLREQRIAVRELRELAAEMARSEARISILSRLWLDLKIWIAGAEPLANARSVQADAARERQVQKSAGESLLNWILRPALRTVESKLGPNVRQLFSSYQWLLTSNCTMFLIWAAVVILPYIISPPPTFSWDKISGSGILGGSDKGLENSFFYFGAYPPTIQLGGWEYAMDVAYLCALFAMLLVQLAGMLVVVWREAGQDDEGIDPPPFFLTSLVTFYFGIEDTAVVRAHYRAVTRRLRVMIQEDEELQRELRMEKVMLATGHTQEDQDQVRLIHTSSTDQPEPGEAEDPCCGWGWVLRLLGILLYLGLYPASYFCIFYVYENSSSISGAVSFGVPLLVAAVRILFPLYLVPLLMRLESRPPRERFWHCVVREFVLKLFTVNSLLYVYMVTTAKPDEDCRQTFIGKTFWRQEVMDIAFHIALDGIFCYKRWKLSVRPEFNRDVLAQRMLELVYRQAYIWTATPYSPMISLLGVLSTMCLFFYQCITVSISYAPPQLGWSHHEVTATLMSALLVTLLVSLIPTWTWLFTTPECGPYGTESPFSSIKDKVTSDSCPGPVRELFKWLSVPTITWACIILVLIALAYATKRKRQLCAQVEQATQSYHDNHFDKAQLMRRAGIQLGAVE